MDNIAKRHGVEIDPTVSWMNEGLHDRVYINESTGKTIFLYNQLHEMRPNVFIEFTDSSQRKRMENFENITTAESRILGLLSSHGDWTQIEMGEGGYEFYAREVGKKVFQVVCVKPEYVTFTAVQFHHYDDAYTDGRSSLKEMYEESFGKQTDNDLEIATYAVYAWGMWSADFIDQVKTEEIRSMVLSSYGIPKK